MEQEGREIEPRDENALNIEDQLRRDPSKLVNRLINGGVAVLTAGANLALDYSKIPISIGRVIQDSRRLGFVNSVAGELAMLSKENGLEPGILEGDYYELNFAELLSSVDDGADLDPKRLEFIRRVYFAGVTGAAERNDLLANRLLKIARSLETDEILLFTAAYSAGGLADTTQQGRTVSGEVMDEVKERSGIPFQRDFIAALNGLKSKGLVGEFNASNRNTHFTDGVGTEQGYALRNFLIYSNHRDK